jgi:hypothetical protein
MISGIEVQHADLARCPVCGRRQPDDRVCSRACAASARRRIDVHLRRLRELGFDAAGRAARAGLTRGNRMLTAAVLAYEARPVSTRATVATSTDEVPVHRWSGPGASGPAGVASSVERSRISPSRVTPSGAVPPGASGRTGEPT